MHLPLKVPRSYICFLWGQARLLGTLAVSRGLGDHQLKVIDTNIEVKPFLSCIPKVSHGTWELQDGGGIMPLLLSSTHILETRQVSATSFFHLPSLCTLPRESPRQNNLEAQQQRGKKTLKAP